MPDTLRDAARAIIARLDRHEAGEVSMPFDPDELHALRAALDAPEPDTVPREVAERMARALNDIRMGYGAQSSGAHANQALQEYRAATKGGR